MRKEKKQLANVTKNIESVFVLILIYIFVHVKQILMIRKITYKV